MGISSLILTAVLLEGGARLALALMGPEAAPIEVGWEPTAVGGGAVLDLVYRPDPDLFFRVHPDLEIDVTGNPRIFDLHTNSLGLRSGEVEQPKPPNRYRILAVGDSCTFCSGAGQAGTYRAQLQQHLAALRPDLDIEVINAGVPGFSFYQMNRYLEIEGYGLEPNVVIVPTSINDVTAATGGPKLRFGAGRELTDREYGEAVRARVGLGITRLLWRAGLLPRRPARDPGSDPRRRVPLPEYELGLREFARETRRRGAIPMITRWPLKVQTTRERATTRFGRAVERYQQVAADVAGAAGMPFVDLHPVLRGKSDLFIDSVHMNATGYRLAAEAIASGLLPQLEPEPAAGTR